MMKRSWIIALFAALAWAWALPARAADAPVTTPTLKVLVSIPPQAECIRRVGGGRVAVQTLVGPGQNPHTFDPSPRQLAGLAGTRLWFTIGMPFEAVLLPRISASFPDLKAVDQRQGIKLRKIDQEEIEGVMEADHEGEHHDEAAEGADPHVWLAPQLMKRMAQTARDALAGLDPAGQAYYEARYVAFAQELDRVHERIGRELAPLKGREVFVYHPAFGYFTDAYGLRQVAVELGGKEPSPRHLAWLVGEAKRRGVRVIFVQPQFASRSAEAVTQAIGGKVLPLDDLAQDVTANYERMALAIAKAYEGSQ